MPPGPPLAKSYASEAKSHDSEAMIPKQKVMIPKQQVMIPKQIRHDSDFVLNILHMCLSPS